MSWANASTTRRRDTPRSRARARDDGSGAPAISRPLRTASRRPSSSCARSGRPRSRCSSISSSGPEAVVPSGYTELDLGRAPARAYRDRMPFNSRYLAPVCVVLGLAQLVPALWIVIAPHSFFAHVGPFGSYNSHYLGDAAAFQAGIAVPLIAAAWFE